MPNIVKAINLDEVARLAGLGLTNAEICLSLGISERLLYLRKRDSAEFAEAIERGKSTAASEVSNVLYQLCKEGNLGAIVWYEKTRRGLSDKVSLEHTMKPVHELSDEELARIAEQ